MFLRLIFLMCLVVLSGCPTDNNDIPLDKDMDKPTPSAPICEAIKTQQACFDQGCTFFATAVEFVEQGDSCQSKNSFGQCLYAPNKMGDEILTSYIKKVDGKNYAVQLNVNVDLPGWTRCGYVSVPPDCDCDGQ